MSAGDDRYASAVLALAELDAMEARWGDAVRRLDLIEELVADSDPRMRSAALALRSRVCWLGGSWEEAFAAANGAVSSLAGLPESDQLARALCEALADRDAEEPARGGRALGRGDRRGRPGRRQLRRGERAHQSLHGEGRGGHRTERPEVLDIAKAATAAGAHEEAFRTIVNFVWSAHGHLSVDEIESVATTARAGKLPPPPSIAAYLELSLAGILFVPAGRWAEAQAILDGVDGPGLNASSALVWRTTVGGLALRRGDLAGAEETLGELRELAVASGEPQRIIPMACVVLPWLFVLGRARRASGRRPGNPGCHGGTMARVHSRSTAIVRTLAAAEELELLADITESVRRLSAGVEAGSRALSLIAAEGLTALAADRADEAVGHLSAATARPGCARACLRQCVPEARPCACARSRGQPGRGGGETGGGHVLARCARLRQPVLGIAALRAYARAEAAAGPPQV